MMHPLKTPLAENTALSVAAVDLGSNSFHMIVVHADGPKRQVVDRLKESVRLAGGLTEDRQLDAAARARAIDCLARFGQRLSQFESLHVRAVGTNTLRQARDSASFIEEASAALGHPIEVIYGVEEARLIYAGVVEDLPDDASSRLVVDIGGGSTELIVGRGVQPTLVESTALGAVTHMRRFFPDGVIRKSAWNAAVLEAQVVLEPIAHAYRRAGWDTAIGASGSIKSILRAVSDNDQDHITPTHLKKLARTLCKAGHIDKMNIEGISDDRKAIFPGGLAVLVGIFESLGIQAMSVSDKALREGVISDLLGRLSAHDSRDEGVAGAIARFGIDADHAQRVARTAARLLEESRAVPEHALRVLRWAAMLHEIGLAIAHRAHHKHGEYMLRWADLHGFSQGDQLLMSVLVRLQRGRLRREIIDTLPRAWRKDAPAMVVALRLAVILHRARDPANTRPAVALSFDSAFKAVLACDTAWLEHRPLTQADLAVEIDRLARGGFDLALAER